MARCIRATAYRSPATPSITSAYRLTDHYRSLTNLGGCLERLVRAVLVALGCVLASHAEKVLDRGQERLQENRECGCHHGVWSSSEMTAE
jgi:hypothetical protein